MILFAVIMGLPIAPYVAAGQWPSNGAEWAQVIVTLVAGILALAIFTTLISGSRAQQRRLERSRDQTRAARRRSALGDVALRDSLKRVSVGAKQLRESVLRGKRGDANLRDAIAQGIAGEEKLRIAVESGLVGEEKLRISVAAGVRGAEALRVSVAEGAEGAEALRVSIEQGIDAASTTLAVVDTVDAAITLYAPDGHILLTNDTARALAALSRSDDASPLEFADDRVTLIPRFDQVLARAARGQLVTRRAYWVGEGDAQRAIMSTSQYVKRESGELIGTVVASHDVTPLARTRDEFLQTVSHELRTPLTSMIGYLEVIEDALDLEDTCIAQEFEVIQRNTNRLLALINDLLLTAENEPPSDQRAFDVGVLATNSINAIREGAQLAGIRIVDTVVPSVVASVDADRIGEVFDKLLSNALKFNRPGGQIQVLVESTEADVIIRVSDTGVGISETDLTHVCERFFRSSSARVDAKAGAGLGLSAAKLIVDAHEGFMNVTSELGAGTTVEVRLPLQGRAPARTR